MDERKKSFADKPNAASDEWTLSEHSQNMLMTNVLQFALINRNENHINSAYNQQNQYVGLIMEMQMKSAPQCNILTRMSYIVKWTFHCTCLHLPVDGHMSTQTHTYAHTHTHLITTCNWTVADFWRPEYENMFRCGPAMALVLCIEGQLGISGTRASCDSACVSLIYSSL